jgi:hypothetical protein
MHICIQNKLKNQGIALKDRKNAAGPGNPVFTAPKLTGSADRPEPVHSDILGALM